MGEPLPLLLWSLREHRTSERASRQTVLTNKVQEAHHTITIGVSCFVRCPRAASTSWSLLSPSLSLALSPPAFLVSSLARALPCPAPAAACTACLPGAACADHGTLAWKPRPPARLRRAARRRRAATASDRRDRSRRGAPRVRLGGQRRRGQAAARARRAGRLAQPRQLQLHAADHRRQVRQHRGRAAAAGAPSVSKPHERLPRQSPAPGGALRSRGTTECAAQCMRACVYAYARLLWRPEMYREMARAARVELDRAAGCYWHSLVQSLSSSPTHSASHRCIH